MHLHACSKTKYSETNIPTLFYKKYKNDFSKQNISKKIFQRIKKYSKGINIPGFFVGKFRWIFCFKHFVLKMFSPAKENRPLGRLYSLPHSHGGCPISTPSIGLFVFLGRGIHQYRFNFDFGWQVLILGSFANLQAPRDTYKICAGLWPGSGKSFMTGVFKLWCSSLRYAAHG